MDVRDTDPRLRRTVLVVVALNLAYFGVEFSIAMMIGSVSLFADSVSLYAVPNNGGWYDFGYFLGIVVFGVGARKSVTRVVYRDRARGPIIDATARRVE